MKFNELLRDLRARAGLTQQELADKTGIPLPSLRNLEQGRRLPGWPYVVKLAKALGVPTDRFSDCDEAINGESEAPAGVPAERSPAKGRKK